MQDYCEEKMNGNEGNMESETPWELVMPHIHNILKVLIASAASDHCQVHCLTVNMLKNFIIVKSHAL
jgi:hypothetical protein